MSISSSEENRLSPSTILAKLIIGAVLVLALNHAVYWSARALGLGELFEAACANNGFQSAMAQSNTLVVGASDVMALDPNILQKPAGIIYLKGAGAESIVKAAEYSLQQHPSISHLIVVLNPVSLASDFQGKMDQVSTVLGFQFSWWLLNEDPIRYFKPSVASLSAVGVWKLTLRSTREIGNTTQRCAEIQSMNGMRSLLIPPKDPYEHSATTAQAHLTSRTAEDVSKQLAVNLKMISNLVSFATSKGMEVSIVFPPLHERYRSLTQTSDFVALAEETFPAHMFDLTALLDDQQQFFYDSNHARWPEGSELVTRRFFELMSRESF